MPLAGKETAEYEAFPGMKFELGAQVVSTGSSFEECEYTCSRGMLLYATLSDCCIVVSQSKKGVLLLATLLQRRSA